MARRNSEYDDQTQGVLEFLEKNSVNVSAKLDIKALPFVKQAMLPVMCSWDHVGLFWGVHPDVLEKIKNEHRKDIEACFTEMIAEWLTNSNLKKTEPNWREVIIAMSAGASGGNPAAALELAGLCKENGTESLYYVPEAEGVDDSEIKIEAMAKVVEALRPVSFKWMEIGVILGLNYNKLKGLRDEEIEECVAKLAKWWLKKSNTHKQFGGPSWKKLVGAIGARIGGGNSVYAKEIAKQHPSESQDAADSFKESKRPCLDTSNGGAQRNGSYANGNGAVQNGANFKTSSNGGAQRTASGNGTMQNGANTKLEMKLQPKVLHYLKDLSTEKLLELGGNLGLNPTELDKIPSQGLARQLSIGWIQEQYNVKEASGIPTWRNLIKALKEVGATGVADKIVEEILS